MQSNRVFSFAGAVLREKPQLTSAARRGVMVERSAPAD
jgi:hypothetical protein